MKLSISQTTYEKLIKKLFEDIYSELEKSIIENGGVLFYEIDTDKPIFYPNYEVLSNGKVNEPEFTAFDYITDYKELQAHLVKQLNEKYDGEKYQKFKTEVRNWAKKDENEQASSRTSFNEIMNYRLFYNLKIEYIFYSDNDNLKFDISTIDDYDFSHYRKKLDYSISKPNNGFPAFLDTPISNYDEIGHQYSMFSISNFIIIDLIHFSDNQMKSSNSIVSTSIKNILKQKYTSNKNPFHDIIYEIICQRFLILENQLEEIFIDYSYYYSSDNNYNQLTEGKLVSLIENLYGFIKSENYLQIMPSLKTNKKVADLFSKALILVFNSKLPNQGEFNVKIASLYNFENKSKKVTLTARNYKQLDRISCYTKIFDTFSSCLISLKLILY